MMRVTMKKIVRLALVSLALAGAAAHAKDQFDRPQLAVPSNAAPLTLAFADATLWDGKRIPRTMQCKELGGDKPASPALVVTGAPEGTESLVVYFANPRSYHNHGLFKVTGKASDAGWLVPAVRSGANTLPKGIELFDGGSTWGKAYNSPCPTSGSWLYTVTVYALDAENKVVAKGEREIGYAP